MTTQNDNNKYPPLITITGMNYDQAVAALVHRVSMNQAKSLKPQIEEYVRENGKLPPDSMIPPRPDADSNMEINLPCQCRYNLEHIRDIEVGKDLICFHGNKFIAWEDGGAVPMAQPQTVCNRCYNAGCSQPCFCSCHSDE